MQGRDIIISAIEASPFNRGLDGVVWCDTPGNVAIVQGSDVMLFDDEGDGIYETHALLQSAGRAAIERIRDAFNQIFTDHNARMIFGLVPFANRKTRLMARWCGMKCVGIRSTNNGPCILYVLPKDLWKVSR